MDYAVGSLSDLITGSKTPNKQRVLRKRIEAKNTPLQEDDGTVVQGTPQNKNKTPKGKATNAGSKRQLEGNSGEGSPPKKNKNVQNAERRLSNTKEKDSGKQTQEDPEVASRTIFVGNLHVNVESNKLQKFFEKYGPVESVRLRGAAVPDLKTPKKVAIIKKKFHPERTSLIGYVKFENDKDALKACEANGTVFLEHHIRVHLSSLKNTPDENKAIFVGNLHFGAEEEDLWKLFESCGPIESVRIVRNPVTGMGKGFGYVNFQNADAVPLALEMENITLKEREVRVKPCNNKAAKKLVKEPKPKKISKPGKPKTALNKVKGQHEVQEKSPKAQNVDFQGAKVENKKKKKFSKDLKQKQRIIKQIAPK